MTTTQVAGRLVELCRAQDIFTAQKELYAEHIVSVEPAGAPVPRAEGIQAVSEKGKQFAAMIEAHHGGSISEPIVQGNFFTLGWKMDVTMKGMGRRNLEEVCVYKVENGKIVYEEFFY